MQRSGLFVIKVDRISSQPLIFNLTFTENPSPTNFVIKLSMTKLIGCNFRLFTLLMLISSKQNNP